MKQLSKAITRIPPDTCGPFAVMNNARKLEDKGRKILHFEIGQPDYKSPPHVIDALIKSLKNGESNYVMPLGIKELKEAVAENVERTRGYKPALNQIAIFPGGNTAIFFLINSLLDPQDEVILSNPGFLTYISSNYFANANQVSVPLKEEKNFCYNAEDIINLFRPKTKMIILNSPNNPTGAVTSKLELMKIVEAANEGDIFVFSDEIYSQMIYDEKHFSITSIDGAKDHTFLLDGFSKAYAMTGYRLAYLVGPEKIIQKMSDLITASFACVPPFIQKAGVAALRGDQSFIAENMKTYRIRRDAIVKGLNSLPGFHCVLPQGAFYAFPSIKKTGLTSVAMADKLLNEAGVACIPGPAFGSGGEGYLRFSFATSIENINEAIDSMKKIL